jgi:hypothetical protein
MHTIAFAIPIALDKTELFRGAYRRFVLDRRAEFEDSRRRLGITSERGFLQQTPTGDVAIVVFDVVDRARMLAGTATSSEPIDVDFRHYLLEAFGLDLARGTLPAPSEQVFCWRREGSF